MNDIITLNTPLNTPFGIIGSINWNWKPPKVEVEYPPGYKIGSINIGENEKEVRVPIKIAPADQPKDASIEPLQGKETTFWIKNSLFYHVSECELCLRYVIVHEFSHTLPQFRFPFPWELRGFGKNTMTTVHQYFTDAIIDKRNVRNQNYREDDPIKSTAHRYGKHVIDFNITSRKQLFEYYIFFMRFAAHNEQVKSNLYRQVSSFPHSLQEKYLELLDLVTGDYNGLVFPIYRLIRDIGELILCHNKSNILHIEVLRRFHTLSDLGIPLLIDRKNSIDTIDMLKQLPKKLYIHPLQMRSCLFEWKDTLDRIANISSEELKHIDDFLSESPEKTQHSFTYFLKNGLDKIFI